MRRHFARIVVLATMSVAGLGMVAQAGVLGRLGWRANWTLGGVPTRLVEVPAAAPFGITACPGVRPGAIVQSDTGQVARAEAVLGVGMTLATAPTL
jgi:hypothetical protein